MNLNSGTLSFDYDNRIEFHLGVVADITINQFLYFQPGVMLSTKGGILEEEFEESGFMNGGGYEYYYSKETFNVYCIELPLMLSLKVPLAGDWFLRANVGPYFDFGFSGTRVNEWEEDYEPGWGGPFKGDGWESEDIYPSNKKRAIISKFPLWSKLNT